MMLMGKGAEADVFEKNGIVTKERVKKAYRHPKLDIRLRKERNSKEARFLKKLRGRAPEVVSVSEFEIKMKLVKGRLLRGVSLKGISKKIGNAVGQLHAEGIVHGDLTTSNMILRGDDVVLIDFGLAERGKIESFATDLKVLIEAAKNQKGFSLREFMKGYEQSMPRSGDVLKRLDKVYARGRYIMRTQ